jgi:8-oxo-dGTP pyrophosphatase MutT (NUDIX family)
MDFCPGESSRLQRRQYSVSKAFFLIILQLDSRYWLRWTSDYKCVEGFMFGRTNLWDSQNPRCPPIYPLMSAGGSRVPPRWSQAGPNDRPAPFLELSRLRKLKGSEQVAAICYRWRAGTIEFLLVQTSRGGRWIFPKGSAETGLTTAQAAALEAFEEAGVHGRMEEAPLVQYARTRGRNGASVKQLVTAHLCEVLWLDPPQEFDRNPTWFTAEKAKRRLRQERAADYGSELARVVDCAVARVSQLRGRVPAPALRPRRFVILENPESSEVDQKRRRDKQADE